MNTNMSIAVQIVLTVYGIYVCVEWLYKNKYI